VIEGWFFFFDGCTGFARASNITGSGVGARSTAGNIAGNSNDICGVGGT
jgi:hypothetical protein